MPADGPGDAGSVSSRSGLLSSTGLSFADFESAEEAGSRDRAIRRLVRQIASEQGVKRDHGLPDLLQLVDRGLLVSRCRCGLPVVELGAADNIFSPAASAQPWSSVIPCSSSLVLAC